MDAKISFTLNGKTPIMFVAPAVANAVFRATGKSVTAMPVRMAAA